MGFAEACQRTGQKSAQKVVEARSVRRLGGGHNGPLEKAVFVNTAPEHLSEPVPQRGLVCLLHRPCNFSGIQASAWFGPRSLTSGRSDGQPLGRHRQCGNALAHLVTGKQVILKAV